MDFELSDEQAMLRDSADRFGAQHYPTAQRLRMLAAGPDAGRWAEMAELGWLGLVVPEAQGGLGAGPVEVMAMMQGFGRHLMLEPFATRCVLAPALLAGGGAKAEALLAALVAGKVAPAAALTEPDGRFDLHRVATRAEPDDGGYRLTGVKNHAEDGADADWFLVSARTAGESGDPPRISLFLLPGDAPGLSVERYRAIDHHRHARLRLDGVRVGAEAVIGPPGEALPRIEAAVDRAIAAHLAEAVGSMDMMREVTLDYLRTRHQFGVAIGSFQVLQHRMVDIDIACEEARSMLYHATLHLDRDPATRRRAVSAAKARVGQCGLYVGRQAVQLHGGLGMSAELIVSHHLKRLMMIDLAYGNADHHKTRFAEAA